MERDGDSRNQNILNAMNGDDASSVASGEEPEQGAYSGMRGGDQFQPQG